MESKTKNADWSVNQHRQNRSHWQEFLRVFPKRNTEKTSSLEQINEKGQVTGIWECHKHA